MITDWDDAYANMAYIPGSEALPAQWAADAEAYRHQRPVLADLAYGPDARERVDLVMPDGAPRGLAVFVHGGYWMKFDKSVWTHFAEGARASGWAVALPSYTLAPEARLGTMVRQVAAAVGVAAEKVPGPIRLAGHSAGGHLVARMLCADAPLGGLTERVERVLAISGLHDLRPLMRTAMNATLGIDEAEALAESPALLRPVEAAPLTAWVGGGERPEFLRQSRLIANIWEGLGAKTECLVDGQEDHFSVIEGLKQTDSPITRAWLG